MRQDVMQQPVAFFNIRRIEILKNLQRKTSRLTHWAIGKARHRIQTDQGKHDDP
jgi:hypothetical protein